jgi:hypothetical protein
MYGLTGKLLLSVLPLTGCLKLQANGTALPAVELSNQIEAPCRAPRGGKGRLWQSRARS